LDIITVSSSISGCAPDLEPDSARGHVYSGRVGASSEGVGPGISDSVLKVRESVVNVDFTLVGVCFVVYIVSSKEPLKIAFLCGDGKVRIPRISPSRKIGDVSCSLACPRRSRSSVSKYFPLIRCGLVYKPRFCFRVVHKQRCWIIS